MALRSEKHLVDFEQDEFGYKDLSKNILDKILLDMELPNCFGIYGNWGAGKSTLIQYLIKHLEDKKYDNIAYTYFDPWKYEYSEQKNLLYALFNSIKRHFKDESDTWKKIMISALTITSTLLKRVNINLQDIKDDGEYFENQIYPQYKIWNDEIEEFQISFDKIIGDVLKQNKKEKIIIFIDDLDRCLPDNAVKLIEAIKNLLWSDKVLFVFAIDRRIISEMIEKKYGLHYGYGDEYLTKIIHYYYELQQNGLLDITKNSFKMFDINIKDEDLTKIKTFLEVYGKEPRIAKYYISVFCTKLKLLDKYNSDYDLIILFLAQYLIVKLPNIFLNYDSNTIFIIVRVLESIYGGGSQTLDVVDLKSADKYFLRELWVFIRRKGIITPEMWRKIIDVKQHKASEDQIAQVMANYNWELR